LGICVEITFSEAKVRDLCCCRERLDQMFGPDLGRKICSRLALLSAAASLSDLPSTPPINLVAIDGKGLYSVALGNSFRLYFKTLTSASKPGSASVAPAEIEIVGPIPNPPAKGQRA
jgi:plasmid maintenance system killer protein